MNTLVPLKLHLMIGGMGWVGLLTTAFYAGYVLSAFRINRFIIRAGSLATYAIFTCLVLIIALTYTMSANPLLWVLGRFVNGFCVATIWIVIKSWCLEVGGKERRGLAMAAFMGTFNSAQLVAQYMVRYETMSDHKPFCVIAILMAASVMTLFLLRATPPEFHSTQSTLNLRSLFKISRVGVLGCLFSGMLMGAMYGLLPSCIHELGFDTKGVSWTMMLVVFGGVLFQLPIGKLADTFHARFVLRWVTIFALLSNVVVILTHASHFFFPLICLIGGCGFVTYALSINLGCEAVEGKHLVSATTGLLVVYGLGAAIGPLLASSVIKFAGPIGIFMFFASMLALTLLASMTQGRRRASA